MSKKRPNVDVPRQILDYTIISPIGKGGFSEVFSASKGGQLYAIKLLLPPKGANPDDLIASIRYEFWVLKDLKHPNIVSINDFGRLDDGRIYLVEELIDGVSIQRYCAGRPFSECEPILIGAIKGLCEVAHWNIIHGDIKPGNILVTTGETSPKAKILDFGMARIDKNFSGKETKKTSSSEWPESPELQGGTPSTMAPELILHRPIDSRSDLYSLGVTFYAALTGKNPFSTGNISETLDAGLHVTPEPLGLIRKDIPPKWARLIHQMMSKNPADRPASAEQALKQIEDNAFVLTPTAFIGRKVELEKVAILEDALRAKEKVAMTVEGEDGTGVSRFVKEAFYRLVSKMPEERDNLAIVEREPFPDKTVLLIDQLKAPKNYRAIKIKLEPLSREEVCEWLESALNLHPIPTPFVDRIMKMSAGHPQTIWETLKLLESNDVLADAAGQVTATTLKLIDWKQIIPVGSESVELKNDFNWLAHRIRRGLLACKISETDIVWDLLEASVEATTNKTKKLTLKAKMLKLKGEALIDLGKFDRARELLVAALEIFKNDGSLIFDELITRNFLSYILLRQGKTKEAVAEFEAVSDEIKEKLTAEQIKNVTNLDLGFAYLQAEDYEKAVERLNEELALCSPDRGTSGTPDWSPAEIQTRRAHRRTATLYNLAQAHFALANYKECKESYLKAYESARKVLNMPMILRTLNGLGNFYRSQNDTDKAIKVYGDALEVALALKDYVAAAATVQNRGVLYSESASYQEAIQDLEDSLKYIEKVPQRYAFEKTLICRTFVELGESYALQAKSSQAHDYLDRAWHMAEDDEALEGFRFWVLFARCRSWLTLGETDLFKTDLSRLNYYATDDEKKRSVAELEGKAHGPSIQPATPHSQSLEKGFWAVLNINRDLVEKKGLDDLLLCILNHAIDLTGSELGVILLADKEGNLTPALSVNAELDKALLEISGSVANKVLLTGKPVTTSNAQEDGQFNQYESVMALNLRSILGLPISFRGRVLGVLYLSHRHKCSLFDKDSVQIIKVFADQAGLALKNHELLEFYRASQKKLEAELDETKMSLIQAETELKSMPSYLAKKLTSSSIITNAPQMIEMIKQVERVADSVLPVIFHGESGTGKELLARFVHQSSSRKKGPFIAINCGALPGNLVESELFGYAKGAFTGADRDKLGLMTAANGGTLFLDEITSLPLDMQVKFLRVLQEREVTPIGKTKPHPIDIRIVAASNKSIRECVREGKFREDLYYRLMSFEATLPPLRERRSDIPLLATHFLNKHLLDNKKKTPAKFSKKFIDLITTYTWPGNVRELQSLVKVAASLAEGKLIEVEALPKYLYDRLRTTAGASTAINEPGQASGLASNKCAWYQPGRTWKEIELLIYASALEALNYDAERVAVSLKVGIATVYKWIRENHLKELREDWKAKICPYLEGTKMLDIQREVFYLVSERHPGHPYAAAKELGVSPVTYYKWAT